jgi:hypothetical protein
LQAVRELGVGPSFLAAGHDVYRLEAKRRFQELLMLVGSMEPENERWLGSRPEQIDGKQIGRRGLLGGSFGIQL